MACRGDLCSPCFLRYFDGLPRSGWGASFLNLHFFGSRLQPHWWDGIFRRHLRWLCNRNRGMRSSMRASSHRVFFSGGRLCSPGRACRDGRNGRSSFTFFWPPFPVTSSPHFLLSATALFIRFTYPQQSTLAFPVSKTSNAQAR